MIANIRMIINPSINTQMKIHTGLFLLLLIKQTVNFMWEKKNKNKSKQDKPGKF